MLFDKEHGLVVFIDWRNDITLDRDKHAKRLAPFYDVQRLTVSFLDNDLRLDTTAPKGVAAGKLLKNLLSDEQLWRRVVECGACHDDNIDPL
jgi:hypothetical protein